MIPQPKLFEQQQDNRSREFIWPGKKAFAVCLTHDVDRVRRTYQYITKSGQGKLRRAQGRLGFGNPYWCFPKIMALEDKFKVRSTFFFLQESKRMNPLKPKEWVLSGGKYKFSDKKVSEIIRVLDRNGWEIGLHGSYESGRNENLLREEKEQLEHVLGDAVIGIRQHYLRLEIPDTWKSQQRVGFLYDASFGFTDRIGFRDNRHLPFYPIEGSFLEIPLTLMDGALFGDCDEEDAVWGKCLNLIETAERRGGLLTVLWHQRVFDENDFPGWSGVYAAIIEECMKRDAYFGTCKDMCDLWTENG